MNYVDNEAYFEWKKRENLLADELRLATGRAMNASRFTSDLQSGRLSSIRPMLGAYRAALVEQREAQDRWLEVLSEDVPNLKH